MKKTIGIASDHAGFHLKEYLKKRMEDWGYKVIDMGTNSEKSVDYPDYAYSLSKRVSDGEIPFGVLICGTGIGMCMTANKVKGIRAALCWNEYTAKLSRLHNNANILCLGGRVITPEVADGILKVWLGESFEGGRHGKRLEKIRRIERSIANG